MPDARASRRRPSRLTPRRARPFLERRRGRPPRLSVRVVVTHASGCRSSFHIVLVSYYPCFESSPTSHSHPPRPRRRAASRPSAFKKFIAKVGHFTHLSSRTLRTGRERLSRPLDRHEVGEAGQNRGTPPFVTPQAKPLDGFEPTTTEARGDRAIYTYVARARLYTWSGRVRPLSYSIPE